MDSEGFSYHDYDGMVMSSVFPAHILDKIRTTAFHDEDIIVSTYPKCGTTWMQEIVYLVQNDGKEPPTLPLSQRYQFIEFDFLAGGAGFVQWETSPPPHFLKTHLGANFFRKTLTERKTKFIVVFRNMKDMLVSYFHFYKMNEVFDYKGTWDEYFELFKNNQLVHGNPFEVQLSWWMIRDDPNVLIVKYEDMLKAPEDAIRQVMIHLGKSLSDDIVKDIVQKTSFKSMKVNPLSNYTDIGLMRQDISPFMRKGQVGDWKNYFNEEQADYVDTIAANRYGSNGLFLEDK